MNKIQAHKRIDEMCLYDNFKYEIHRIINEIEEPECKHYHLELRNNGKHECLNCRELFSVKRLR